MQGGKPEQRPPTQAPWGLGGGYKLIHLIANCMKERSNDQKEKRKHKCIWVNLNTATLLFLRLKDQVPEL